MAQHLPPRVRRRDLLHQPASSMRGAERRSNPDAGLRLLDCFAFGLQRRPIFTAMIYGGWYFPKGKIGRCFHRKRNEKGHGRGKALAHLSFCGA